MNALFATRDWVSRGDGRVREQLFYCDTYKCANNHERVDQFTKNAIQSGQQ